MKKIGSYLFNILAVVTLSAIAVVIILTRFGWRVDCVVSSSMEPAIGKGSFVLTRPVDAEEILVGDVIVFRHTVAGEQTHQEIPIIHRVIEATGGNWFRTKGDANDVPDPYIVHTRDVIGRVCLHLPYLGRALQLARTPPGIAALVCCFCGLMIVDLTDLRKHLHARKRTEATESHALRQ